MKVQRIEIKQEEQFVPFAIQINIESKEEAQALYAIFNNSRNSNLLNNAAAIKDAIGENIGYLMRMVERLLPKVFPITNSIMVKNASKDS